MFEKKTLKLLKRTTKFCKAEKISKLEKIPKKQDDFCKKKKRKNA